MPEKSKTYEKSAPRVYIRTFGCQMNDRDSEFIAGLFLDKGYKLTESPEEADVILFNTCSVRAHAEERAINNMALLMHRYKGKIYGMVGCAAQALKGALFERLTKLDIVCGTGEIVRLPELVEKAERNRVTALGNLNSSLPELKPAYRQDRKSTYVSIMRGCNNFCSYCVVPYVRGKERSRDVEDIVDEIKDLAQRKIKVITLLGQNVNSYGGLSYTEQSSLRGQLVPEGYDSARSNPKRMRLLRPSLRSGLCSLRSLAMTETYNFTQLLKLINEIDGVEKVRFLTSHPKDATIKLFEAIRDLDKVIKHLHLPLQSGSDRILKLMNRGYTRRKYLGLVKKAREIIPGLRLTTDIIVGFPTEREKDFDDTLNLMKEIKFDLAYIFKYSPRSGTAAAKMKDDVPREVKRRRNNMLLELQKEMFHKRGGCVSSAKKELQ